jgi:hypothetical protein
MDSEGKARAEGTGGFSIQSEANVVVLYLKVPHILFLPWALRLCGCLVAYGLSLGEA